MIAAELDGGGEPAPGQSVGRYVIERRIGAGGMGVVFAARDPELDRSVALKLLHGDRATDAGTAAQRSRLVAEAQAMARIRHPGVVAVYDAGVHDGRVFLVMELVEGTTLRSWLAAARRDWRSILTTVIGAGRGLAAAHAAGIVHRDIKPDNVLVDRDGRAKVTDFGIALTDGGGASTDPAVGRGVDGVSRTGPMVGTPAYMSPDQHRLHPADTRADQFSFCVVLAEALYGERPFGVDDDVARDLPATVAVGLAIISGRRRPPPVGTRVPRAVDRVIARGLETDREARWGSLTELLDRLERAAPPTRRRVVIGGGAVIAAIATAMLVRRRHQPAATVLAAPVLLSRGEETITEPPTALPDGALVIASDRIGGRQLFAIADGGRRQYAITSDAAAKHHPQVVGAWLYFLRDGASGSDLVRVPIASLTAIPESVVTDVGFATAALDGAFAGTDAALAPWGGPRSLWLQDERGRRPLYDAGTDELRWVAWSPQGDVLAVVRRPPAEDHLGSLWLIARDGHAAQIAHDISAPGGVAWRGRAVLAFRGQGAERRLVAIDADPPHAERTVVPSARGGILPAAVGRSVAYVEDSTDWGLWQTSGGPLRRLSFAGDAAALSPSWSASTGEFAAMIERGGGYELVRASGADLATINARRAITSPTSSVAFSADGHRAAYGTYRGDQARLELVELDGATPPRVLARAPRPAHFLSPQFLADGRIGYVVKDGPGGASAIWDIDADGASPIRRVAGAWNGTRSDDGRWMALGRDGHGMQMWLAAVDGSVPERPLGEARSVRFDPRTGDLLVVDGSGLDAVTPATGARRHVVDWPPGTSDVERIAPHPDGRVTCSLAVGRAAIVLVPPR